LTEVDTTLTGATSAREDAQEAEARRRAYVFLQAMRNPEGRQETTMLREDYRRRNGKEPAASGSIEAE